MELNNLLYYRSRFYFPEEFRIFRYFPVVPSGTTFPYATRKRKRSKKERQSNVIYTSATYDLHTYFLHRSELKFIFLLKNQQPRINKLDYKRFFV